MYFSKYFIIMHACVYVNVELLIHKLYKRIIGWGRPWIMTWFYECENIHLDCDCGLLIGWGVTFWYTNLGSLATFWHKYEIGCQFMHKHWLCTMYQYTNNLGFGYVREPLTCDICVLLGCEMINFFWTNMCYGNQYMIT